MSVEEVEEAVREAEDGPGQLLGYRSLHKKVREGHGLPVPRGLVYDVMTNIDPEGLERRILENIVPEIISKSIVILPFSIHNSFRHFE